MSEGSEAFAVPLWGEIRKVDKTLLIFWQNKWVFNFLDGIFRQNCFIIHGYETEMDYFDKQQITEEWRKWRLHSISYWIQQMLMTEQERWKWTPRISSTLALNAQHARRTVPDFSFETLLFPGTRSYSLHNKAKKQ